MNFVLWRLKYCSLPPSHFPPSPLETAVSQGYKMQWQQQRLCHTDGTLNGKFTFIKTTNCQCWPQWRVNSFPTCLFCSSPTLCQQLTGLSLGFCGWSAMQNFSFQGWARSNVVGVPTLWQTMQCTNSIALCVHIFKKPLVHLSAFHLNYPLSCPVSYSFLCPFSMLCGSTQTSSRKSWIPFLKTHEKKDTLVQ